MTLRPFGDDRDDDLAALRAMALPSLPDPVLPGHADDRILRPLGSGPWPTKPAAEAPTLAGVTEALRAGSVDVVDLVQKAISDLESSDLGVLQVSLPEIAMAAARESRDRFAAGTARPLEGVPFGVKDIIAVAGAPTTYGSPGYQGFEAGVTATVVRRLQDAGAIPVAKLRTYEFAAGPNDLTVNPHDRLRMSGGSSSGSASAVGAGILPVAVGTDSGGSVRVPAAWCGAVGLKPTYGWVSRHGVAPLSWTLDHVGFFTRSPSDCLVILDAVAGRDPLDPYSSEPRVTNSKRIEDLRIGVPRGWFRQVSQPDVLLRVEEAAGHLASQGFELFEVDIPELDDLNADIVKHVLVGAEAASIHDRGADTYGDEYGKVLANGRKLLAVDYARALRARAVIQEAVERALAGCDLLLTPGSPITAPIRGTQRVTVQGREYKLGNLVARCTSLFDITGHPAITVPFGADADGMPVGVQLVGGLWADRQVIEVASVISTSGSA